MRFAQFSPDGQRVVTASDAGTAVTWDIAPSGTTAPKWLLSLAETISGQVLTKGGVLQLQKVQQARTLGPILDQLNQAPADDPCTERGRWFLAAPASRTISPYCKISVAEYIENRLKEHTAESLELAERAAEGDAATLEKVASAPGRPSSSSGH